MSFFKRLYRVWKFLRDPKTQGLPRVLALLGALYLLWPLDLLPGLPPFSWIDDVTILYLILHWLEKQLQKSPHGTEDGFIDVEGKVR